MLTLDLPAATRIRNAAAGLAAASDFELTGQPVEARPIVDALRQLASELGPVILELLLLYIKERAKTNPTPDAS